MKFSLLTMFFLPTCFLLCAALKDVKVTVSGIERVTVNSDIGIYIGEEKGIQGHQNSCYLDATLFGLFALSQEFDEMFVQEQENPSNKVGSILWRNIVNPLRRCYN